MIRVCADISGLAYEPRPEGTKYGILRVIECILDALVERPELSLAVTGLRESEPLLSSFRAESYPIDLPKVAAARTRLGIGADRLLSAYFAGWPNPALPVRLGVKLLKQLDTQVCFPHSQFDVFQSLSHGLPPRSSTGSLPRSLWVYDLICLRHPELVNAHALYAQQQTLVNFDRDRDFVVCNAAYVRADVCDYLKIPEERVFIAPLAVGESFTPRPLSEVDAIRARYGLPQQGPYLLAVGDPQARKNLKTVLAAYAQLRREHPETPPLVLQGKHRPEHDPLLLEAGVKATFTGFVEDTDLPALYSGATVFLFPSLAEGFGLPPLEALRCGTPVVVSNTTTLPEVVGEVGLTVPPTDPSALAAATWRLLTDTTLQQTLRPRGIAWAEAFTWDRCVDGLKQQYEAMRT